MPFELKDFWTAGGILLGFEITAFSWRISQESKVAEKGDIVWLAPADYLNLLAMLVTAAGVFVLPSLNIADTALFRILFGLAAILFVGHAFALAGHYELYNPLKGRTRSFRYFPPQEKVAVGIVAIVSIVYLIVALRRM